MDDDGQLAIIGEQWTIEEGHCSGCWMHGALFIAEPLLCIILFGPDQKSVELGYTIWPKLQTGQDELASYRAMESHLLSIKTKLFKFIAIEKVHKSK